VMDLFKGKVRIAGAVLSGLEFVKRKVGLLVLMFKGDCCTKNGFCGTGYTT
jgi:hypothetical protein